MPGDPQLDLLLRDPWAGQPATRGSLPRVPSRPELATASEALRGCLVRIPGASGVADATYECQKQAAGTYAWVQIDSGGPLGLLGRQDLSSVTFSGSVTSVASITAVVAASRTVRLMIYGNMFASAADSAYVRSFLDGTGVLISSLAVGTTTMPFSFAYLYTPASAGSHTFEFKLNTVSGSTGTISFAQVTVENIGSA